MIKGLEHLSYNKKLKTSLWGKGMIDVYKIMHEAVKVDRDFLLPLS